MIYTAADIHFTVLGYIWIAIWYTFAVFEMVWVKKVVDSIQQSTWSRTFYQVRPPSPPPPHPRLRPSPSFSTLCPCIFSASIFGSLVDSCVLGGGVVLDKIYILALINLGFCMKARGGEDY